MYNNDEEDKPSNADKEDDMADSFQPEGQYHLPEQAQPPCTACRVQQVDMVCPVHQDDTAGTAQQDDMAGADPPDGTV